MSKNEDPYVKKMADALALVHLTERPAVSVSPFDADPRVDFLVRVRNRNRSSRSEFGVIVKGTIDLIESEERATEKLNAMEKKWKNSGILMCICLFLFSVKNKDGFYAWKWEPIIDGGGARLVHHTTFQCKELDEKAMDAIIDSVDKWYEARSRSLAT